MGRLPQKFQANTDRKDERRPATKIWTTNEGYNFYVDAVMAGKDGTTGYALDGVPLFLNLPPLNRHYQKSCNSFYTRPSFSFDPINIKRLLCYPVVV